MTGKDRVDGRQGTDDPLPRPSMAELLARFDPKRHRRPLAFDAEPIGTETA